MACLHLPQKSTIHVGKYTRDGWYGLWFPEVLNYLPMNHSHLPVLRAMWPGLSVGSWPFPTVLAHLNPIEVYTIHLVVAPLACQKTCAIFAVTKPILYILNSHGIYTYKSPFWSINMEPFDKYWQNNHIYYICFQAFLFSKPKIFFSPAFKRWWKYLPRTSSSTTCTRLSDLSGFKTKTDWPPTKIPGMIWKLWSQPSGDVFQNGFVEIWLIFYVYYMFVYCLYISTCISESTTLALRSS